MKIAIVCSRLCFGGAERVAVMWANGFANREHEVILISNLFEEQTYYVDKKIRLYNLVSTNRNKIKKWSSAIWNVRKIVGKEQPDVIIGVMETCSLVSWLGSLGFRIPIIMTEHNSFERPASAPMTLKSYIFKFYVNKLYRHVTVLTLADKILIGNRLKNVSVMPNPLFLSQLQGKPIRNNTFLAAGRLDDWHYKGFDVLIKSFAKLLNGSKVAEPRSKVKSNDIAFKIREEGWKLQIAGTGSEESLNYLKQLCRENGVEDLVEFLGFRKDVEKLYQDASIFVLSSRYEGFGLVLIEAMSQGCACVACDYKGRQREIMSPTPSLPHREGESPTSILPSREGESPIESQPLGTRNLNLDALPQRTLLEQSGEKTRNLKPETRNLPVEVCETGILCEPDNVEALAAGIQKMIEDDEYRESVRAKAIERSKYYSIENTMDRWEFLLEQVNNKK